MIGGLFAGTEESPGETILYQGRTYKLYRGRLGSRRRCASARGSRNRYMQDDELEQMKLVPEGIEGRVPHKGPLSFIVAQLVGGLKGRHGLLRLPHRSPTCTTTPASCASPTPRCRRATCTMCSLRRRRRTISGSNDRWESADERSGAGDVGVVPQMQRCGDGGWA